MYSNRARSGAVTVGVVVVGGGVQRSWLLWGALREPLRSLQEALLKNPVTQTRAPSSSAAWAPRRAHSRLECFHFPHTYSLSEITVSNYWLTSAAVALMRPSFSASLKAHRFLHTLNPVMSGWISGPPFSFERRLPLSKPSWRSAETVSPCRVGADGGSWWGLCSAVDAFSSEPCRTSTLSPLSSRLRVCGLHSCVTVMAYWAGGAPEAIRARGMRLCTCWSHKGPLWRPCHRVEQTSYRLAKLDPRQLIPQFSSVPTTKNERKVQVRGGNGQCGWEGWLRGTGWAVINSVSYICTSQSGTQSFQANYWGDLDSTRPAPELGTIKPTIRERKRERARSHVVCNL